MIDERGGVRAVPLAAAAGTSRVIGSADDSGRSTRGPAVWVGDVDELWKLPRPTGRGGPWRETDVKAGSPSDPYLMGGYDRKTLKLSHDAGLPVRVSVEIDPSGDGDWFVYATLDVPMAEPLVHEFPQGFSAQWVRFTSATDCRATAELTYR